MIQRPYRDRRDAGRVLAKELEGRLGSDPVVLGLPRGGVPVAAEVALALQVPLDVLVVRKLGLPQHPELAMGAVASGGARVLNPQVIAFTDVTPEVLREVEARERQELARRETLFRGTRPPLRVEGREVVLVDDGLATGATMEAAVAALRSREPARIVVAVPVGSEDGVARISRESDLLVCPLVPPDFHAVGQWYERFGQTDEEEVRALLAELDMSGRASDANRAEEYPQPGNAPG